MEVLILLIFVSLVLVTLAIGLFAWGVRTRVYDHADRLALLPLEDDVGRNRTSVPPTGGTRSEQPAATPKRDEGLLQPSASGAARFAPKRSGAPSNED